MKREYLERLVDASHVDYYLSAIDGARVYWPWRMLHAAHADDMDLKRFREMCSHLIVDSAIGQSEVGNREVLDVAHRLDADAAVLADEWHDIQGTVGAILDGLDLADDHPYGGEIIVPLQPDPDDLTDFSECYRQLEGYADYYAVGGLKDDASSREKAMALHSTHELMSDDEQLHGLGIGATSDVIELVQRHPEVVDSIDTTTPYQNARRGVSPGQERTSVAAVRAQATMIERLREMSSHVTPSNPGRQARLTEAT